MSDSYSTYPYPLEIADEDLGPSQEEPFQKAVAPTSMIKRYSHIIACNGNSSYLYTPTRYSRPDEWSTDPAQGSSASKSSEKKKSKQRKTKSSERKQKAKAALATEAHVE